MVNKKSLPREDRKHLREFLSFNPFFKEMESHLGSPDKLGGKILNFPEKVIPLCHE